MGVWGCEEAWGNVWGECGGCKKVCWCESVRKCVGVRESYGWGGGGVMKVGHG